MKAFLALLILLITNTCIAETFEEYLNNPEAQSKFSISNSNNKLDCGVVIEKGSLKEFNILNKLCNDVIVQYKVSFPEHYVPKKLNIPVSFLPSKVLVEYFGRKVVGKNKVVNLDGFTDINSFGKPKHFYVLSDWKSVFYLKTVFAHELFHVLNALNNYNDSESEAINFTISLGLGK